MEWEEVEEKDYKAEALFGHKATWNGKKQKRKNTKQKPYLDIKQHGMGRSRRERL